MGWFPPTVLEVVELVKTIVAIGAMLKSFSPTGFAGQGDLNNITTPSGWS
jgi:hypothetical protein